MSILGDRAYQTVLSVGLPITAPLVDNTAIGSFWTLLNRQVGTGKTLFSMKLGRQPSGFLVIGNEAGGIAYATADDVAFWSATQFAVRASVAGVYAFLVC